MIKKIVLLILLVGGLTVSIQAQKVYSTKIAQVRFISSAPTEDFDATNNQVESKLSDKGQVMFGLLIKGFVFENELMQKHFNGDEYMESDKFPKADFKGTITNIASVNFFKDGAYPVMVTGDLTIRGISKKQSAAGLVIIEKGKVSTKSTFKIKIKDYGLKGSEIGTAIAENIEINVEAKYE